jgi:hypothetical protein
MTKREKILEAAITWGCVLFVLYAVYCLFASSDTYAAEGTQCDQWANFTKVVTYRLRDEGEQKEAVKAKFTSDAAKFPDLSQEELPTALAWIDYSYAHPDVDSVTMWGMVYEECKAPKKQGNQVSNSPQ